MAIPFLGIVGQDGYIESYDYAKAEEYDFHHNFIMSKHGLAIYEFDSTLRFVMYKHTDHYTLEGIPSLDPFKKGMWQISLFASYTINQGAPESTRIYIADQYMNSQWEGKCIGELKDWAKVK